MALTKKQINDIREDLQTSKKPLIFFHDDADGLCSFLILYKYMSDFFEDCKGIIIKTTPKIDNKFLRKVREFNPDKIFIVDIAIVEQEFLDEVNCPVTWIDHHQPLKLQKVKYYNPRLQDPEDNLPVSLLTYQITQENLWISAIGTIGDWHWPEYQKEFKEKYPDLLDKEINDPETALFESKIGQLVNMISFCLKGTTSDAMKYVKAWTRVKSPYEILNQETSVGKFIYKRYATIKKDYEKLKERALKTKPKGELLIFEYKHTNISFTKELANEFLHIFPDKIIIIAREKNEQMKMSIRSKEYIIPPALEKALSQVEGYGGGHEHACGANVAKKDFEKFASLLEENIKESR